MVIVVLNLEFSSATFCKLEWMSINLSFSESNFWANSRTASFVAPEDLLLDRFFDDAREDSVKINNLLAYIKKEVNIFISQKYLAFKYVLIYKFWRLFFHIFLLWRCSRGFCGNNVYFKYIYYKVKNIFVWKVLSF